MTQTPSQTARSGRTESLSDSGRSTPSYILTTARAAANAGRDTSPGLPRPAAAESALAIQPRELTGAVQNALHGLGITNPRLLQRAADVDQAAEQLILHAAEQRGLHQNPPSPLTPNTSALTHDARTSSYPPAATRPHHPVPSHQHEPPEAEP